MRDLASLIFAPVPLPWAQLRARLPRAIALPDPEGESDDDEALFKRIDRVTPDELQQHLNARIAQLLLDIEHIRLLGEVHERAVAAGCDRHAPALAAIERQSVSVLAAVPNPSIPSPQGAPSWPSR